MTYFTHNPPPVMEELYLTNGLCPYCAHDDTYEVESAEGGMVITCVKCKREWLECHKTVGILLDEKIPHLTYASDDVQQLALVAINEHLEEREKLGALISEADFLFGATAAMSVASGAYLEKKMWGPGCAWSFMVIGNRSVLAEHLREDGQETLADRIEDKQATFTRRYRYLNDMANYLKFIWRHTEFGKGLTASESDNIRARANTILEDIGEYDPDDLD